MIDSHSHINKKDVEDIDSIIKKIQSLEYLKYIINVGLDLETSKYAIDLANENDKFYSVIGVHPLHEGNISDIYNLYKNSVSSKIIGIGETGLDIVCAYDSQLKKFHESIDLANTLKLPLVIHANKTNQICLDIIKRHFPNYGFIFHCFEPNLDILEEVIKLGGYISVGTPITMPTAKKSVEVIRKIDITRLLIELDYPYMSKRYPEELKNIFNKIMEIRNMEYESLEEQLEQNTKRLFYKM